MLAGQTNALAQLISLAENDSSQLHEIMEKLRPHLGKAYCVGITGPPGYRQEYPGGQADCHYQKQGTVGRDYSR
ncbi:hypothetical protein ES707_10189 [subsurface metagenome]